MTKPTEIARLQAAWRTAAARPDGLTIPCPDLATARNIRFKLYNAVKSVRDGTWAGDAGLVEAVDAMKISVRGQPPAVVIDRKPSMTLIDAALAAVGVDPETAQEPATAELAGSLERVLANVASAQAADAGKAEKLSELWPAQAPAQAPAPAANPFFTREPRDAER